MSAGYSAIQWNAQKRGYDLALAGILLPSIAAYVVVSLIRRPEITVESLILRASALASFALLNGILCIGPLARLDARFLPLLYNRRHLGVTMFLLALLHAGLAVFQFHALSDVNPLASVFTAYAVDYAPLAGGVVNLANFPFEPLGLLALGILFVMAATSHDFWLRNLGPSFWKTLHTLVMAAYALLVAHVAYGALQSETNWVYPLLLGAGLATVVGLHVAAALREARGDERRDRDAEWVTVCPVTELEEGRGRVVRVGQERVALFLDGGRVHAISNVCRHQGGPLGEGRILDGCVTCPWHGWQYRPQDGCSPPPFNERVETYRVRIDGKNVQIHPEADPPGTPQSGAAHDGKTAPADPTEFYVGYFDPAPPGLGRRLRRVVASFGVAGPLLFAILAVAQNPLPSGGFEFGVSRVFEGVLHEKPLSFLRVTKEGSSGGAANLLLVGPGKHGPPPEMRGHGGQRVRLAGSLIYQGNLTMVEVDPASFQVLGPAEPDEGRLVAFGPIDVVGELVDAKCYLGVMRPATGKVHRGCAVRCLAGGVPPGLLVTDSEGKSTVFLLVGPQGGPLPIDPQMAARRFRARGRLELHDGLPVLRTDELAVLRQHGTASDPLPGSPLSVRMVGARAVPRVDASTETQESR